jgi:GT2 family glycosyltransferase/glycosyltransferase involved in cell wall biosynthesis/uncharacterized coiled-coil DUF342 family protein
MTFTFDPLNHPIVFRTPRRLTRHSGWIEHIPFAMFLVGALRPDTFVELGTQAGDSYCGVCEAVDMLGLSTRCYAVDSWKGDPQTGTYGPEILEDLRAHHDPLYGGFSRLIESTFDKAALYFADGSIDLLHIDGYHTYETVRHDFDVWLPKMSPRGIVLFHDINVREHDFGVWRVWDEVRVSYPSFSFTHAHGLGVLGVGAALPDSIRELFRSPEHASAAVRQCFDRLGHRLRLLVDVMTTRQSLVEQTTERERAVNWLKGELQRAQEQVVEREEAVERARESAVERDRAVHGLTGELQQAHAQLTEHVAAVEGFKRELQRAHEEAAQQRLVVESLQAGLQGAREEVVQQRPVVESLQAELQEAREEAARQRPVVESLQAELQRARVEAAQHSGQAELLEEELRRAHEEAARRGEAAECLRADLRRAHEEAIRRQEAATGLNAELKRVQAEVVERDRAVDWLKGDLRRANAKLKEREQAVEQLTQEFARLRQQELAPAQLEASRLWREQRIVFSSRSWRFTAPARRVAGVVRTMARAIRRAWYGTVFESISFSALTPATIEVQGHDRRETVRWDPPLRIGEQASPTLFTHPPARVTYRLTVPPRASFRSLIALTPEVWGRNHGGVDFGVSVSSMRDGRSLHERWHVDPTDVAGHRRWMPCRLGLGSFAHQEVELSLTVSVAEGASSDYAHAVWGDPVVMARKLWRSAPTVRAAGAPEATGPSVVPTTGGPPPGLATESPPAIAAAAPPPRGSLEATWAERLRLFLADPSSVLAFPAHPEPRVSIVIPTFDRAAVLYQCLESVLAHTAVPYELIVIDDGSQDDTAELLTRLQNVVSVRNEQNLEFIGACNRGVRLAKGRYILFLNNDVTVTPRWLSILVETMERYPQCGAVGAKLIRPDGKLQEAGSIVWNDGSALGYGRDDDDPLRPEYCYLREVDFASAACLLVAAEVVRELGGFDERYQPAYYEDADLCFGVRRLGRKVVFQPRVSVFHTEFGSRSLERAQALCAVNRPAFAAKWARQLGDQSSYGHVLRARDRREGKRVLVMDDRVPSPDLGAGFPRAFAMLQLLVDSGFVVTFVPLTNRTHQQPATRRLQDLGIEVFYGDTFDLEGLLRDRVGYYDVVVVSRPHNGETILPLARRYFPDARIVYDAEALFCAREFRKAQLDGQALSDAVKHAMLRRELDIMKHADVVITVSESERDMILREAAHSNVAVWGHAREVHEPVTPFAQRRDLLFVGGFMGIEPPNVDAAVYFASQLLPAIRERLPDCRFVIAGNQPPPGVCSLAADHIVVAGYVEDLTEHYETCRIFVAPLRFGAGISLKVIEAMSYGIPTVVSAVGALGLDLQDGSEALIARSDEEFVDKVVRLYEDETLWTAVQSAGLRYVKRQCSPESMRKQLADALAL